MTFGGAAATNVVVVNSTTITATTPAGSTGAVTVTVTNPGGQSGSLASAFTYLAPPTVSSVSPNSGSTAGGTAVTITGTNFAAGATVTFGGAAATNVVVVNSTTITATTPAGSAGAVTVTVTVNGQSGSLSQWVHLLGSANGEQCVAEQRIDGGRDGSNDHGHELCRGSNGDVWRCGSDQRGGGEQHDDHSDDAGRKCGSGDGDGHGQRAKRKFDQRIHLCGDPDGDQCVAEQRTDSRWDGGNDYRDELCGGSDGDVWRGGGDQCGGSEQHDDHGDDAGRECGGGDGDGDGERAERKPDQWVHLHCCRRR